MDHMEKMPGERLDDLQIKGYKILQKTDGFCFGMDAVLLSDYARVKKGAKVMDLCSGTGIVPILLEAKYPLDSVDALEYQESYVDMARRSLAINGQEGKIRMDRGDVKEVRNCYSQDSYDYVTCNPPYMTGSHGKTNGEYGKAISRHEILCTLEDVVSASAWLLKHSGHLIMVHRPFRLVEIFAVLREFHLEPKRMQLVYPYIDREPNMVLIEARKRGNPRLSVEKPLIVYEKPGVYTRSVLEIYHMV